MSSVTTTGIHMSNLPVTTDDERRLREEQIAIEEAEESREHKNPAFVQLAVSTMDDLFELGTKQPTAMKIIGALVKRMNKQNAVMMSQATLAKITDMDKRTVIRALKYLEEHRWIEIIKIGTTNAYAINSRVFWKSTNIGRFAHFNAALIADEEEQPKKKITGKLKHYPVITTGESVVLIGKGEKQEHLDL